jgi:hypothetical protein
MMLCIDLPTGCRGPHHTGLDPAQAQKAMERLYFALALRGRSDALRGRSDYKLHRFPRGSAEWGAGRVSLPPCVVSEMSCSAATCY